MKKKEENNILWSATLITAGSWAYTLATRLTDFLFASRLEKVNILASLLILALPLSALLFILGIQPLIRSISKKTIFRSIGIGILLTAIAFIFFYQLPPFPEHHNLKISVPGEKNSLSDGARVEIISISTVSIPGGERKRIPTTQLDYGGVWRGTNYGYGLLADGGKVVSLGLNRFMQAGVEIKLQTNSRSGLANITWDGIDRTIDLYSPEPGEHIEMLKPALDWRRADFTRKILVGAALLADFVSTLTIFVVLILVISWLISGQKVILLRAGLLFLCVAFILVMQFFVAEINTPVLFENPDIENLIRETLNKPTGNIFQRQLLTVVDLDASNRNISSLEGIEVLPNLIDLNLLDNLITDISPLIDLPNLQKLNLRNNRITDLSPLAQLSALEYLNIHSNASIGSIKPIGNLVNLHTLIMGYVPIRDETSIFENLNRLRHLNIRNSGINNLDFLTHMRGLEYLNLYSNSKIQSIQPLQNLTKLNKLILTNIPIADEVGVLENMGNLNYLNLRNTSLTDITSLSKLSNLEYLNLHSNPNIGSILPIQNLNKMQHLILRDVPVGDEAGIFINFPDLRTLNIRNCGILDVSFLGTMMSKGALQDDPRIGTAAAIDIRDNPLPDSAEDQYAAIRPYWDAVSESRPFALPFYADLDLPEFSHASGFLEENFHLSISTDDPDAEIHFTLDGSDPLEDSPVYREPIMITSRAGEPDRYSAIESISPDWNKPADEVEKAVVVRAIAINKKMDIVSPIATRTYFVGPGLKDRYTLPIVSLVTDPENLFDDATGIYVLGETYLASRDTNLAVNEQEALENYHLRGREWERPVHIELFAKGGSSTFSQNGGIRIHGSSSRSRPQKSLRLLARNAYDWDESFAYPLFEDWSNDSTDADNPAYNAFLLRNSGQDWMISMFRDALAQDLVNHTNLDTQSSNPVIVFLNGEYWGVYRLQERYDERYLANHYSIPPGEGTILIEKTELYRGNPDDISHFSSLLKYARINDLSQSDHFEYVRTQMDIDNYIDYQIANIFTGNTDWPHTNLYYWRKSTESYEPDAPYGHDGRWRWMLFDMDFVFGFQGIGGGYNHNTLQLAQSDTWSGRLFQSLLMNDAFKTAFISRFADHLNSTFTSEVVVSAINQEQALLAPEMEEFFERWITRENAMLEWEDEVEAIRNYARKRPKIVRQHIIDQFELPGTAAVTVTTDSEKGYIRINSLELRGNISGLNDPDSWSGIYFQSIPVTITAVPDPGYTFSHWAGIDEQEAEITLELNDDLNLTAVFIEG